MVIVRQPAVGVKVVHISETSVVLAKRWPTAAHLLKANPAAVQF
jgi:hypothetical protein